jgi:hypothetical protein
VWLLFSRMTSRRQGLPLAGTSAKFDQMKTVLVREFTTRFPRYRNEECLVKSRRKVLGTWKPAPKRLEPVNFEERVKQDFKHKLPFTFAELLKEGKKR